MKKTMLRMGLMAEALRVMGGMPYDDFSYKKTTRSYRKKSQLTPKQKRNRAKSKAARKSRRKNR